MELNQCSNYNRDENVFRDAIRNEVVNNINDVFIFVFVQNDELIIECLSREDVNDLLQIFPVLARLPYSRLMVSSNIIRENIERFNTFIVDTRNDNRMIPVARNDILPLVDRDNQEGFDRDEWFREILINRNMRREAPFVEDHQNDDDPLSDDDDPPPPNIPLPPPPPRPNIPLPARRPDFFEPLPNARPQLERRNGIEMPVMNQQDRLIQRLRPIIDRVANAQQLNDDLETIGEILDELNEFEQFTPQTWNSIREMIRELINHDGDVRVLREFFDRGLVREQEDFSLAISRGRAPVVAMFLETELPIPVDALALAVISGNTETLRVLFQENNGNDLANEDGKFDDDEGNEIGYYEYPAVRQNLEMLRVLFENNVPYDNIALQRVYQNIRNIRQFPAIVRLILDNGIRENGLEDFINEDIHMFLLQMNGGDRIDPNDEELIENKRWFLRIMEEYQ